MQLKDFAAVAGKPGLWRVIKPSRTGLILESYDDKKTKMVTGPGHRVSVLSEISIYTDDVNKTIPLSDLYKKIFEEFGDDPGVDPKSDSSELRAFMQHVAPDHDEQRVYPSDIKKLLGWYLALSDVMEQLLTEEEKKEKKKEKPSDEEKTPGSKKAGSKDEEGQEE